MASRGGMRIKVGNVQFNLKLLISYFHTFTHPHGQRKRKPSAIIFYCGVSWIQKTTFNETTGMIPADKIASWLKKVFTLYTSLNLLTAFKICEASPSILKPCTLARLMTMRRFFSFPFVLPHLRLRRVLSNCCSAILTGKQFSRSQVFSTLA